MYCKLHIWSNILDFYYFICVDTLKLQLVEGFTSEDVAMDRVEYRNNDNSSLKVKEFARRQLLRFPDSNEECSFISGKVN